MRTILPCGIGAALLALLPLAAPAQAPPRVEGVLTGRGSVAVIPAEAAQGGAGGIAISNADLTQAASGLAGLDLSVPQRLLDSRNDSDAGSRPRQPSVTIPAARHDDRPAPPPAAGGSQPWASFFGPYGGFGSFGSNDPLPGADGDLGRARTGLGHLSSGNLTLGWMADWGRATAPEDTTVDLFQTGPYGNLRLGGLSLGFVSALGSGSVATHGEAAGGAPRNGAELPLAATGFALTYEPGRLAGFPLAPELGYRYARVATERPADTLLGGNGSAARGRAWLGAVVGDPQAAIRGIEPSAYGRIVRWSGDRDGEATALLPAAPGTTPLDRGSAGETAAEFGVRLRMPLLSGEVEASYDGRTDEERGVHGFKARVRLPF